MNKQYDNSNSGTLGKNKRKEKDSHPDYSGQINVNGVGFWLSAWLKENKETGEKFFSLSVKPKEERSEVYGDTKKAGAGRAPMDDEIPFLAEFR